MPGGYRTPLGLCNPQSLGTSLTALGYGGVTVVPSATINSKGAWVQIGSSLANSTSALELKIVYVNKGALDYGYAIDIAFNAVQQILISNINVGSLAVISQGLFYYNVLIPMNIAAGIPIYARCAANLTSGTATISVSANVWDTGFSLFGNANKADAIGVTATGKGVACTPGNASKGSYTVISAATIRDYIGFFVIFDCAGATTATNYVVDIAFGPGGSEQIKVPDILAFQIGSSQGTAVTQFYDIDFPMGTRITARAANLSNVTTNIGVTFYGVF